jgi:hypothetical protein
MKSTSSGKSAFEAGDSGFEIDIFISSHLCSK